MKWCVFWSDTMTFVVNDEDHMAFRIVSTLAHEGIKRDTLHDALRDYMLLKANGGAYTAPLKF